MKARFTDEQIIAIIKEQEAGEKTADVCRRHGISSATFYKYKSKYGGMEPSAYSGVIRPPVPIASGHPYRFDPAGDSGASGHPQITLV
jgi:putative transposase